MSFRISAAIRPPARRRGSNHFARYQEWLASLGEAAIKPMVPYKGTRTLAPDGSVAEGSSTGMTGHTIVRAETIEQAIEYAKTCPFLEINGTSEVAEIIQMPG